MHRHELFKAHDGVEIATRHTVKLRVRQNTPNEPVDVLGEGYLDAAGSDVARRSPAAAKKLPKFTSRQKYSQPSISL